MKVARYLSLIFISLTFMACQNNEVVRPVHFGQTQLRGVLSNENGQWILTGCAGDTKRYQLIDNIDLAADVKQLSIGVRGGLFIDVLGVVNPSKSAGIEGEVDIKKLNRLTTSVERGCNEQDFNKVVVRSIGRNPLWATSIALKGLVLERLNTETLVLPYVQERLLGGQMNFATEANGQRIELWVAPEHCVDEDTGEIYSMTARLTINYQTFKGCAYLGQAAGVL